MTRAMKQVIYRGWCTGCALVFIAVTIATGLDMELHELLVLP